MRVSVSNVNTLKFTIFVIGLFVSISIQASNCKQPGVWLQVLGSGGPEVSDQRASSSYLLGYNGKAQILVDTGSGSMLNFEKSKANFNDIQAVVFTHLHLDHSADFPAYIKASFFSDRQSDLLVLGPGGNQLLPAVDVFIERLLGKNGAWPYLSDHLTPGSGSYQINTIVLDTKKDKPTEVYKQNNIRIKGIPVHHGPLPAVAWRIELHGKSVVFSGDTSHNNENLYKIAHKADLFVAHNAVPENIKGVGRNLHMPPSEIGRIAKQADVDRVVLSHRMKRTIGREAQTLKYINSFYSGKVEFAEDLSCFSLGLKDLH